VVNVHDLTVFAPITSLEKARGATMFVLDLQVKYSNLKKRLANNEDKMMVNVVTLNVYNCIVQLKHSFYCIIILRIKDHRNCDMAEMSWVKWFYPMNTKENSGKKLS